MLDYKDDMWYYKDDMFDYKDDIVDERDWRGAAGCGGEHEDAWGSRGEGTSQVRLL